MSLDDIEEALVQAAFNQIAFEKMLTILPIGMHRAAVPSHWWDESYARALPYIRAVREVAEDDRPVAYPATFVPATWKQPPGAGIDGDGQWGH